ncbi:MAG: glutamyl-tRNA amidotransferase [Eubacteriales bacterium]
MSKFLKLKKAYWFAAVMLLFLSLHPVAYAATVDVQQGMDPLQALGNLTSFILTIVTGIGVIALIWGGVQLALALKSQDASQRTNAILFLAGGMIMVGIRFVLQAIGVTVS